MSEIRANNIISENGLNPVGFSSGLTVGTAITCYAPTGNINVGSAISMYASSGIVSATEYYGSGANLTDVISGVELKSDGNSVGTAITQINFSGFGSVTAPVSGFSTVSVDRFLTIGVRSGAAVTFSIADSSFIVQNRAGNDVTINL